MAARWLLLLALLAAHAAALPDFIRIGGLFHPSDDKQEVAFRYAAEKINANRDILPKSRLSAQVEVIQPQDSFHASKREVNKSPWDTPIATAELAEHNRVVHSATFEFVVVVCHLLRGGVAAIFGPQSAHTASHVQSICDTMEIPHLETRWDYRLRRQSCLVNLYPHPTTLSKAYVDLVKAWGWKSFTIIYENNEGLVRLQELLKAHGPSEFPITVRQLSEGSEYRVTFFSIVINLFRTTEMIPIDRSRLQQRVDLCQSRDSLSEELPVIHNRYYHHINDESKHQSCSTWCTENMTAHREWPIKIETSCWRVPLTAVILGEVATWTCWYRSANCTAVRKLCQLWDTSDG
ncbi:Glutamate receptor, ionotropic kainate 1 [Acromyrmex echinatior]|uniref:Glutamate receptor, ionotropic kainate 1 n=1 Tax=Acromyrmex echinatior TaxID=103372 RepID=F4WWR4_ACREC|nr:Glutamate receptor, ionotropic kainate 1 [Acromyrmex echinatior]